jgi:hypothetical protein
MKKFHLIIPMAICAASMSLAQTVSESVTTTAPVAGTVTTFDPTTGSLIVTDAQSTPITYVYKRDTTIVDDAGNPVAVDVIRSGVPVSVYYTKLGDKMVVSKMVVQRAVPAVEQTTTTTTTTTP